MTPIGRSRITPVVIPGKAHPAGLSRVRAMATTNNPGPDSHKERIELARAFAQRQRMYPHPDVSTEGDRMQGLQASESGALHRQHIRDPYDKFSIRASGEGSTAAHNRPATVRLYQPGDFGPPMPESSRAHSRVQNVSKPRS